MVPLPLGLNCVALAAGNAGHQVELIDLMSNADPRAALSEAIGRFDPRVIGISVRNVDNQNMREPRFLLAPTKSIVSFCRRHSNAPIVVGGSGFSIFAVAALRYLDADMGVRGEGEIPFRLLLDALEQGGDLSGIAGLCFPGKPVQQGYAERAALAGVPIPPAGAGAGAAIAVRAAVRLPPAEGMRPPAPARFAMSSSEARMSMGSGWSAMGVSVLRLRRWRPCLSDRAALGQGKSRPG